MMITQLISGRAGPNYFITPEPEFAVVMPYTQLGEKNVNLPRLILPVCHRTENIYLFKI